MLLMCAIVAGSWCSLLFVACCLLLVRWLLWLFAAAVGVDCWLCVVWCLLFVVRRC